MADTKTTALTENTDPILTDIIPMVDDPGGAAATKKVTLTNLLGILSAGMYPGGRLTLTTGVPVTTADVSAAATLYYTPYIHDNIRLYDGTSWRTVAFTEKSLNIAAYTASKPYDIWGYLSGGTLALESLIWTNTTTRATALAYQNGRLTKSGDATRLYLGTIYINSSGGQTDDSVVKRNVYNYYNRINRRLFKADATQHNYTTASWRAWNNDATQSWQFMVGVSEDAMHLTLKASISTSGVGGYTTIGLDSTAGTIESYVGNSNNSTAIIGGSSDIDYLPAVGLHTAYSLEFGATTVTFYDSTLRGMVRA